MPEDVGILRPVVLGHVHVKIGRSSGLFRVVTDRASSSGCGRVHQHLLRCMVHGVTDHEGSSSGGTRTILGVVINLVGRLLDHPAHEIDLGYSMSKFGRHELRWIRTNTSKHVFAQASGTSVHTGAASG